MIVHPAKTFGALADRWQRLVMAIMVMAIVAIFAADLGTPLGIGVPFLYLLVVLCAIGLRASRRVLLAAAMACTTFAVLKLWVVPTAGVLWYGQSNRVIFALLIWTAVGLEFLRRRFDQRIRAAESRFAAIFEQALVGVAEIGEDDRFIVANQRYGDLLRRSPGELLRLRLTEICHPRDAAELARALRCVQDERVHCVRELRLQTADGTAVWVAAHLSPLPCAGERTHVVMVVEDIAERREVAATRERLHRELEALVEERTAALQAANQNLRREIAERRRAEQTIAEYAARLEGLSSRLVEAQEDERKNLASELHDRIGQNLSALSMNLTLIESTLPPAVASRIRDSQALVERTTEIVRGVMEELHPVLLDQYGLDVAIRWYAAEYATRTGIRVRTDAVELFPRLRGQVEMALFRVFQEALTNVAKHARATEVAVSLERDGDGIRLRIRDDGVGIPAEVVRQRGIGRGWGLRIIGERVRAVGGCFALEAAAPRGTLLRVTVGNGSWEVEHGDSDTDC